MLELIDGEPDSVRQLARGRCTRFLVASILGAAGKGASIDSVCGSCCLS